MPYNLSFLSSSLASPNHGHKYRRHAGTDREPRSGSSGSSSGGGGGGHRTSSSSSQLSVDMSEVYVPPNGRVEITCLATIPAHVGPGEQYADYKTFSVKSECCCATRLAIV